ncbi:MAG: lysoplasmalogenase [Bacteroidales bacterium]|nr:lysoplasmalogenase [Bacteroidales bacterium]
MRNSSLKTLFAMLFVTASLVNLVALSYGNNLVASIAKPLLMPFLALTAYFWLKENDVPWSKLSASLISALAFGTIGDIFLMFSGKGFFIAGMAAFFAGHVCYSFVLLKLLKGRKPSGNMRDLGIVAVAVMAMMILMWVAAKQVLSFKLDIAMGMIVFIYALAFPANVYFSAYGTIFYKPLWITAFGYLFFAFSDGLIGLNVFRGIDFDSRHLLVMLTYIVAQAMIVCGIAKSIRSR